MEQISRTAEATTESVPFRWETLDVLRFLAAAAVVAYHYAPRMVVGVSTTANWARAIAQFGYLGVELFFVISGAVIVLSAGNKSARAFLVLRAVRLYPMFWIALGLAVSATMLLETNATLSLRQVLANITMLPGYLGETAIDDAYWTLAVEWKFYFLVSVLLVAGLSEQWERIARIWVLLIAAQHMTGPLIFLSSITIYPYGSHFAFGVMLLAVRRLGPSAKRLGWASFAILACIWTTLRVHGGFVPSASESTKLVAAAIVLAVFGLLLLSTCRSLPWRIPGFARSIGSTTYPLYLLHAGVLYPVSDWLQASGVSGTILPLVVLLLLTCLTIVSTRFVENRLVPKLARSRWVRQIAGLKGHQTKRA